MSVDCAGNHYTDTHTGAFLSNLKCSGIDVQYAELAQQSDKRLSLQTFCLQDAGVPSLGLSLKRTRFNPRDLRSLINAILLADAVYIFFPGSLANIVAGICLASFRCYGLYVRGEQFGGTFLSRLIMKHARFALTVSPRIRDQIMEYCQTVSIIKPMVSITVKDEFRRPDSSGAPSQLRLLYVGRIEKRKGSVELIEAAHQLRKLGISFDLRFVGDGPLRDVLTETCTRLRLSDYVTFVGPISDKKALMAEYESADLFVFPSHDEGFPRVLYEAMIKSLPIVTSFVGGIPGLMVNGWNCLEIPPRDGARISKVIAEARQNFPMLRTMGNNGLDTVLGVLKSDRPHHELLKANLERFD